MNLGARPGKAAGRGGSPLERGVRPHASRIRPGHSARRLREKERQCSRKYVSIQLHPHLGPSENVALSTIET